MKFFLTILFFYSTLAIAEDKIASVYTCTHKDNDFVRQVKVIHLSPGCQVNYIKADETGNKMGDVIYNAQNSTDYCDEKSQEFVEKRLVGKFGWMCDKNEVE